MKKLTAILLLLFYLPATSGVAISSYLCCGKIISVKIQLSAESCGQHHVQSKDKDCCNDIGHFYKIQAPQQVSVSNISCKAPVLSTPIFTHIVKVIFFSNEENTPINEGFFNTSPPRTSPLLFVRNQSFLI